MHVAAASELTEISYATSASSVRQRRTPWAAPVDRRWAFARSLAERIARDLSTGPKRPLILPIVADGGRTPKRLHAAEQPEEAGPTRVARISPRFDAGGLFFSAAARTGGKALQACPIWPGGYRANLPFQDIGRT